MKRDQQREQEKEREQEQGREQERVKEKKDVPSLDSMDDHEVVQETPEQISDQPAEELEDNEKSNKNCMLHLQKHLRMMCLCSQWHRNSDLLARNIQLDKVYCKMYLE